jgi:RNA polymerase sigma factor (sigma-70 family)
MSQPAWDTRGQEHHERWPAMERARSGAGDAAAVRAEFRTAWAQHAQAVADRCAFLMGSRGADVDEATSRTSLTALRKYPAHRHRIQDFRRWLLGIARNACMDIYRERNRTARLCPARLADVRDDMSPASGDADPEQRLLAAEQLAVLRRAVEALPRRLREPLQLRLQERPDREIAAALGLSGTTVRKRLQEARDALRPVMCAYRDGGGARHGDDRPAVAHRGPSASV